MNPAPMPAITALYAGVVAILLIVLAIRVSLLRRELRVGLGDGGDPRLQRAIRAHANAVEWAIAAALAAADRRARTAAPPLLLHVCGIALVSAGRLLHAIWTVAQRRLFVRPFRRQRAHLE